MYTILELIRKNLNFQLSLTSLLTYGYDMKQLICYNEILDENKLKEMKK
jgi:hypothetical protein